MIRHLIRHRLPVPREFTLGDVIGPLLILAMLLVSLNLGA
jgi:hypothetical protein